MTSQAFFFFLMQVWIKKIYISPSKLKVRPNNLKKQYVHLIHIYLLSCLMYGIQN